MRDLRAPGGNLVPGGAGPGWATQNPPGLISSKSVRKSLNSGPETPHDPQYDSSPSPFPHGSLWHSPPAPPWAHSCPLAFLLVPTPAIQWGPKPQEAGVCLPSLPHPMPDQVIPPTPLFPGSSQVFRHLKARKSLSESTLGISCCFLISFLLVPFPVDEESPFLLRVRKVHTGPPRSSGKSGSSLLISIALTG